MSFPRKRESSVCRYLLNWDPHFRGDDKQEIGGMAIFRKWKMENGCLEVTMKRLTLNGKQINISSDTVVDLLNELSIPCETCAVAVNGEIVSRAKHPECKLNAGDCVEIIRPIGGG